MNINLNTSIKNKNMFYKKYKKSSKRKVQIYNLSKKQAIHIKGFSKSLERWH